MTPLVKGKAAQAAPVVFWCFVVITLLIAIKVFSPPGPGAVTFTVPGSSDFSSPSSEARSRVLGSGFFMSTMDLQRELNRLYPKLKLKVDGVYGPATKAAHERACGDQYAKELMVWLRSKF